MKYFYFLILALVISCGPATESDPQAAEIKEPKKVVKEQEVLQNGLTQNGDYSTLFERPDCNVITEAELSAATGVPFTDNSSGRTCNFTSEMDGKSWILSIVHKDMSIKVIQKEIKTYKEHPLKFLTYEISETEDTYLCNQHSHGYLSLYNEHYEGLILLRYGSVAESSQFSKQQRLEQRAIAFKIANALLKKHKA